MNKHLQNYFNSFKLKSEFFCTLIVDGLSIGVIIGLFFFFAKFLESKAMQLTGGQDVLQLKQMMLTASPETVQLFAAQLKSFVLISFIGGIIIILAALFIFSLSRSLVWYKLLKIKLTKKNYWKWNTFNLILLVLLLVYCFIFIIVKIVLVQLVSLINNPTLLQLFNNFLTLIGILIFISFLFIAYYSFAQKYKVWIAIGNAFNLIKSKWTKLWKVYLFALLTLTVISIIIFYIEKALMYQSGWLGILLSTIIFLLFISWARIYLLKTITLKS